MSDHVVDQGGVHGRQRVDGFPGVRRARNAEAEAEVVRLDQLVPEVVALDHPEVRQRLLPDGKNEGRGDVRQPKEILAQLVVNFTQGIGVHRIMHAEVDRQGPLPRHFEDRLLFKVILNNERQELDPILVRRERAQEFLRRGFVPQNVRGGRHRVSPTLRTHTRKSNLVARRP